MKHIIDVNNTLGNCKITIRLDDDCRNGHERFSITANFWKVGAVRNDANSIMSGCCHDEIMRVAPELEIFIDLHLHDFRGIPMYYIDNGFYHIKNSKKEDVMKWYKLSEGDYNILNLAENKDEFAWLLIHKIQNHKIWEGLAKKAIAKLEQLTGEKFVSKATRIPEVKYLDGSGASEYSDKYFDLVEVEKRRAVRFEAEKLKRITEIEKEFNNKINDLETEKDLRLQIVKHGFVKLNNVVYYPHRKVLVLNAFTNFGYKFTEGDFVKLKEKMSLPEGVTLELGEKNN